jgi:hypothetical protein
MPQESCWADLGTSASRLRPGVGSSTPSAELQVSISLAKDYDTTTRPLSILGTHELIALDDCDDVQTDRQSKPELLLKQ